MLSNQVIEIKKIMVQPFLKTDQIPQICLILVQATNPRISA